MAFNTNYDKDNWYGLQEVSSARMAQVLADDAVNDLTHVPRALRCSESGIVTVLMAGEPNDANTIAMPMFAGDNPIQVRRILTRTVGTQVIVGLY